VADSAGVERAVPMDDWIDVGVFAPARGNAPREPLYLRKHRIRAGKQQIKITVPGKPARAGIDPSHLLIDPKLDDNTEKVKIEG
jgi:hypothetical protein